MVSVLNTLFKFFISVKQKYMLKKLPYSSQWWEWGGNIFFSDHTVNGVVTHARIGEVCRSREDQVSLSLSGPLTWL